MSPAICQSRVDTARPRFYSGAAARRDEEGKEKPSSMAADPKRAGMLSIVAALLTPS